MVVHRSTLAVGLAAVAALALSGCSSSTKEATETSTSAAETTSAMTSAAPAAAAGLVGAGCAAYAEQVPTGHGQQKSVRDKGYLWVANQAMRIAMHALLVEAVGRIRASGACEVILIEPEPTDGILFMHNPTSFSARRAILEYAYRTTRERVNGWLVGKEAAVERAGWQTRPPVSRMPPPPLEGEA